MEEAVAGTGTVAPNIAPNIDNIGIDVDPCFFLTKQQTEDLTSGNFNPGDCLALFVSCDRGVSILACMGMSLTQQKNTSQGRWPRVHQAPTEVYLKICNFVQQICRRLQIISKRSNC